MNREIKFRLWNTWTETMYPPLTLRQLVETCDYTFQIIAMQFSGLKDKNGKEIYEGDIVKLQISKPESSTPYGGNEDGFEGYALGEVVIHKRYGVSLKHPLIWDTDNDILSVPKTQTYKTLSAYRSEVIGNIYEHKHLLTAQFSTPKKRR